MKKGSLPTASAASVTKQSPSAEAGADVVVSRKLGAFTTGAELAPITCAPLHPGVPTP